MSAERGDFLQTLVREGYLPSEDLIVAFGERSGRPVPMTSDAVESRLRSLRTEIDDFAERYWNYLPDERRTRWTALDARSRAFAPDEFLIHLQKGLDLTDTIIGTDEEAELIAISRRLFRLRPRAKTVARLEWLAEHRDAKWARIAQSISKSDPQTADLEPEFIRAVAYSPSHAAKDLEDRRTTSPYERSASTPEEDYALRQERLAVARTEAAATDTADSHGALLGRIGLGILIFILIFGLRAACSADKRPPPKPAPSTSGKGYNFVPPQPRPTPTRVRNDQPLPRIVFTPSQIEEFETFDPKSGRLAPPRYYLWKEQKERDERSSPTSPAGK